MDENIEVEEMEVIHEEIIVHPTIEQKGKSWNGTARILGQVRINGKLYKFMKVVPVLFKLDD